MGLYTWSSFINIPVKNQTYTSFYFCKSTQFNNKEDLESYPFNLRILLFKKEKVDLLFVPEYSELYGRNPVNTSFNELENVLEGKHRKDI